MKKFSRQAAVLILVSLFVLSSIPSAFAVTDEEIQELRQQIKELNERLEKMEAEHAATKQEAAKAKEEVAKLKETQAAATAGRVDLNNALSKLKIKGRWAAGYYNSGKSGSFDSGSFEVPEAKVMFTFSPDDINNIVLRLNLNNATFNNVDYFYIDTDLKKLLNLSFPLASRLGRMKVDFGEETWCNNPAESVVVSNSAPVVNGNDEGLQLSGKIGKEKPLGYAVSVTNGTSGTGSDTSIAKAFAGKLYYNIIEPLYASASYYNSGQMKSSNSEMSIGGLASIPAGGVRWSREIWEIDLRYDFQKGKVLMPFVFSDSKAFLRFAYGGFGDDISGGTINKRDGKFGYVEGLYNLTKKFYVASRVSFVDLDGATTASLNGVTANLYRRYSLGGGYRISGNTILKLSYDWNRSSGPGIGDPDDDLVAAVVASQF